MSNRQTDRLRAQPTQASIFIWTAADGCTGCFSSRPVQKGKGQRGAVHTARMDHLRGSARRYRRVGDAVCKVKQASLLKLKVLWERRTNAVIWKWKASFFVQPTTLHQVNPLHHPDISLAVVHSSIPSIKQLAPDSPAVVQAHLITGIVYFLALARAPNTKVNRPTRAHWPPQQTSGHHYCCLSPSTVS